MCTLDGAVHYGNIRPPAPQPWWWWWWWWYWITTHSSCLTELILWHTCWQATHDGWEQLQGISLWYHIRVAVPKDMVGVLKRCLVGILAFAMDALTILAEHTNWWNWCMRQSKFSWPEPTSPTSKLTNHLPRQHWRSLCIHNLTCTFLGHVLGSKDEVLKGKDCPCFTLLVPMHLQNLMQHWTSGFVASTLLYCSSGSKLSISTQFHLLGAPNLVVSLWNPLPQLLDFMKFLRFQRVLPNASIMSDKKLRWRRGRGNGLSPHVWVKGQIGNKVLPPRGGLEFWHVNIVPHLAWTDPTPKLMAWTDPTPNI